jgi:hypothetical protein
MTMRSLIAILAAGLAAGPVRAEARPEQVFLDRLAAMGPVELQAGKGLDAPDPAVAARLSVPSPDRLELVTAEGQVLTLALGDGDGLRGRWGRGGAGDEGLRCGGDLEAADILVVECFSRFAEMSRARARPSGVLTVFLEPDGPRVTVEGGPFYSPRGARTPGSLPPGLQANLAGVLKQMAEGPAVAPGLLTGGASGRGQWYGTSLKLSAVDGLDFVLRRLADREEARRAVTTTWSFAFQGAPADAPDGLLWRMRRSRPGAADRRFWCRGEAAGAVVTVSCHPVRRPANGVAPAVAFRLSPYPEWSIDVAAGEDNPYRTAGSARLRTRPSP